jgi:type IV pilus biogenesis protein CpaD/CtpE
MRSRLLAIPFGLAVVVVMATAVMAGGTWRPNLQSSQLAPFTKGTSHFLTSEEDGRTYRVTLEGDGRLSSSVFTWSRL